MFDPRHPHKKRPIVGDIKIENTGDNNNNEEESDNPLDKATKVLEDDEDVNPEPGDESGDPDVDLENMTLWEHITFWGELIYQFTWQM